MSKKLKQRTETTSVVDLRKRLSSVDSKLSRARRNMALADGDDLRIEYETVVHELRQERERLDASIQDAQKPRGRPEAELDQRIDQAVKTLTRLRSAMLPAPVPKQRALLAACIDKIEVWSTRSGGKGSTYHLEHGVVHLRPTMWLTEAESDKLSSTTRSAGPPTFYGRATLVLGTRLIRADTILTLPSASPRAAASHDEQFELLDSACQSVSLPRRAANGTAILAVVRVLQLGQRRYPTVEGITFVTHRALSSSCVPGTTRLLAGSFSTDRT